MTQDSGYQKIEGSCQIGECKRRAVTRGLFMRDAKEYLLCRICSEKLSAFPDWQIVPEEVEGTLDEQAIDQKLATIEQTTERKCLVCTHWYDVIPETKQSCLPCYRNDEHPNFQRVDGMSLIRKRYREEHQLGTK